MNNGLTKRGVPVVAWRRTQSLYAMSRNSTKRLIGLRFKPMKIQDIFAAKYELQLRTFSKIKGKMRLPVSNTEVR